MSTSHSPTHHVNEEDLGDNLLLKRVPRRQRQKHSAASLNLQNSDGSFLDTIKTIDESISGHLAVCANVKSPMFYARPIMKFLEYTCHGVPWILASAFGLILTHKVFIHEILLNFLLGEI